jgi:hypothetical protein
VIGLVNSALALDRKRGILPASVAHGAANLTLGDQDMTSDTLRKIMIVGAAFAAISVGACKKPADNTADANATAASDANAAMASSNSATASSNSAAAAANTASNDASATAPASTNSMSK